jgi:hypothetical protein
MSLNEIKGMCVCVCVCVCVVIERLFPCLDYGVVESVVNEWIVI